MTHNMWALVNPEDIVTREEVLVDPTVQTKPGWRWLAITDQSIPVYDSDTQVLEGPQFSILEQSVERYWTVRSKTQEEIDYDLNAKVSSIPPAIIDILFTHENRIRALEQQASITKQDFIDYIKTII